MKRIIHSILIITSVGIADVPAFANNWQWQLGQIKADQQRRDKCHAAEQAKPVKEKSTETPKRPISRRPLHR
ncbi:MAG: hypothetical protein JNN20_14070 [Betaproteobacteria bacterium]|nr:hypothetical protein [Betaproteobacteria bacterium]